MAKEIKFQQGAYKEAVDYFRQKINLPTKRWNDLEGAMHTRAFTVAGAMRDDILCDFRKAVDAAITKGESLESFRDRFNSIAEKWRATDSDFDKKMNKAGYAAWRSKVIYQTNMLTCAAAAQERQARAMPDVFTHAKYVCMMLPTSREQHQQWNGIVLPVNDPWWNKHSPPNGFGCLCEKEFISKYEIDKGLEKETKDRRNIKPQSTESIGENWDYSIGDADMGKVGLYHKPGSWQLANQKGLWESSKEPYPSNAPIFEAPKRTKQTESIDEFTETFMQKLHEEFDGDSSARFDEDNSGVTILKQIGGNTYPIRIEPKFLGNHFYKDSKNENDYKKRVARTTLINFFIETLKNPGHIRTEFSKDNTKMVSIDMTFYSEFKEKNRTIPIKFAFKSMGGNLLSWTAYDANIPVKAKGVIMK